MNMREIKEGTKEISVRILIFILVVNVCFIRINGKSIITQSNDLWTSDEMYSCVLEECSGVPVSRRDRCVEMCLLYSKAKTKPSFELTGNMKAEEYDDDIYKFDLAKYDPILDNIVENYYSPRNADFQDSPSNKEGSPEQRSNPNECLYFCENVQRKTNVDKCVEVLCSDDLNTRLRNLPNSNMARQNTEAKTVEKRWPSRLSCLEVKCGRFADNQERFYDCGVRQCSV